eukprot:Gb_31442 [translate_table: standard]
MAFHNNKYCVFVSFRGADVRQSLVDHLFQSLLAAGIPTFLDSEELAKGDDIQSSLEKAIEDSEIYIPIFSTNYAESPWCLKELSLMCEHISTSNTTHKMIPLFYQIEPRQVRHPDDKRSPYAKAFHDHSTKGRYTPETINQWKSSLEKASHLSGWSLEEHAAGYEGKLVKQALMEILSKLNNGSLYVAKQPVGLTECMNKLKDLLKYGGPDDNSVRTVGIRGMGGIGKTTLSKAENSNLRGFKCCDFENVVTMESLALMKNLAFLWLENVQLVGQEKTVSSKAEIPTTAELHGACRIGRKKARRNSH